MEITDNPHVTRFVPPTIIRGARLGSTHRPTNVGKGTLPVKNDQPSMVQDEPHGESNPLAALFDPGSKPVQETPKIGKSDGDQPVRGRFVDILA